MWLRFCSCLLISLAYLSSPTQVSLAETGDQPQTGPETEKRFPPLVVPAGFKATLFACDPLVEYPSVIALGPRPKSLFVAHDYVTGLGIDIVRRDEIRLLEDTDGDGYADRSTVYAGGFNSIQGLAYHDGAVYAMHAPLLTALRDTNGDGVADERRDLLNGLGLTPEKNPTRLHCANGVTVGHDGWLYLSMGDNGTDVERPEGDRLVFHGGGILRCRPDGRDLHVFATGLRNIYDVALDDQMNVFVRDNENDGGDYMIRVYHSFHGADHGYPYLYYERPDEALRPMADLGRGSSAGGVCYLETAFPEDYRGNLFFCEWGRAVVRYKRDRSGSGFAPTKEIDFAAGAANDPYGFKPTDAIVDRDGSLLVSDWCDGQRPKRGRGRIYRIAYVGPPESPPPFPAKTVIGTDLDRFIAQLDSPIYATRLAAQTALERAGRAGLNAVRQALRERRIEFRGRLHAVWILAAVGGRDSLDELFEMANSDSRARVRAQAVRAIADLTDPVFIKRRLDAGRGDAAVAARLTRLKEGDDPRVLLEIVVALGRLQWSAAPGWLHENLKSPDYAIDHAAMQTLRRCGNWPAVLKLLDEPDSSSIRAIALRAIAGRVDAIVVDGLIERLQREREPSRRKQYADALTRVHNLPGPWVYWGYRPPPRPANTVTWDRSDAIAAALDRVLADPDRDVRAAILVRMQRENVPARVATLDRWLREERTADRVTTLLEALAKHPANEIRPMLTHVVQTTEYPEANRLKALAALIGGLDETSEPQLLELADRLDEGPVLAQLLAEFGKRPKIDARHMLLRKLDSPQAGVRAAAVASLAGLQVAEAAARVPALLHDRDPQVRRAAASAAGKLSVKESADRLLQLAREDEPEVRGASLDALKRLREPKAVSSAVAALNQPAAQPAALEYLADFGGPEQTPALAAVASYSRSVETLASVVRALTNWEQREPADSPARRDLQAAVAKVQGASGLILSCQAQGPLSSQRAAELLKTISSRPQSASPLAASPGWRTLVAAGVEARFDLGPAERQGGDGKGTDALCLAVSDVFAAEPTRAQFLAAGSGTLQVWLNGVSIHRRETASVYRADSERFEAALESGLNRIVIQIAAPAPAAAFHLRFRRLNSSAEQERLTGYVLQNTGDVERGRQVFLNADKSLCLKCHRLAGQGATIGPDLTGLGSRFSRIHLIESILEPSRTIAPSYETITVALSSGRVVTGVKTAEDGETLTLGDEKGETHKIPKRDIEERTTQPRSIMPDGLEKRINDREFLDLVTFLAAQRKPE